MNATRINLDTQHVEMVIPTSGRAYGIVEVQSDSNPNKKYRVDISNRRCSCQGWTMHARSDGTRNSCKHLRALGF